MFGDLVQLSLGGVGGLVFVSPRINNPLFVQWCRSFSPTPLMKKMIKRFSKIVWS